LKIHTQKIAEQRKWFGNSVFTFPFGHNVGPLCPQSNLVIIVLMVGKS